MEVANTQAFQLAYLLIGTGEGALAAVAEASRLADSDSFWLELATGALRRGRALAPDRFFLRSLSEAEGPIRQLNRMPLADRELLLLAGCGALSIQQVASLLRQPVGALEERLTRLQGQVGEPTPLYAALLTTVPPLTPSLQRQMTEAQAGEAPGPEPTSASPVTSAAVDLLPPQRRRRWPRLLGGGLVAALALLLVLGRLTQAPPTIRPVDELAIEVESPAPAPIDLTTFQANAVVGMTMGPESFPLLAGVSSAAEKVLQWLGEATVVGTDPEASSGNSFRSFSFRFADGRVLWVQAQDECRLRSPSCLITVGGEGAIPLVLQQEDLSRWMGGRGWLLDLDLMTVAVWPAGPGRLRTDRERRAHVEALLGAQLDPRLRLASVEALDRLDVFQVNGRWRTAVRSTWWVLLHPKEPGLDFSEEIMIDEGTGEIVQRLTLTNVSPN